MVATYLCALCGVPSGGPPRQLTRPDIIPTLASTLAKEILAADDAHQFSGLDVEAILLDALQQHKLNAIEEAYDEKSRFSHFHGQFFQNGVAIGFFDSNRRALVEACLAGGKGAEERAVTDFDNELGGSWDSVIVEGDGDHYDAARVGAGRKIVQKKTGTSPLYDHPNFWFHEGCYRYLEAWLKKEGAPERYETFPHNEWELGFAEELWDIVNQLQGDQGRSKREGLIGAISYEPISKAFEYDEWQNYYETARIPGSPQLSKAIANGFRGADLSEAFMLDFNVWMALQPDDWPHPPEPITLAASTSSKPDSGLLKWLLPSPNYHGEVDHAVLIFAEWLSPGVILADDQKPWEHKSFPWSEFTSAVKASMSMRNRARLYAQVKQWEKLWVKYRKQGGLITDEERMRRLEKLAKVKTMSDEDVKTY